VRATTKKGKEKGKATTTTTTTTSSITCFWVLGCGLGGPRPRLDVAPLLEGEDEASVPDDDLSCIQTLQDALRQVTRVQDAQKSTSINVRKGVLHFLFFFLNKQTKTKSGSTRFRDASFLPTFFAPGAMVIAAVAGPLFSAAESL